MLHVISRSLIVSLWLDAWAPGSIQSGCSDSCLGEGHGPGHPRRELDREEISTNVLGRILTLRCRVPRARLRYVTVWELGVLQDEILFAYAESTQRWAPSDVLPVLV